jgi:hypothetical protein
MDFSRELLSNVVYTEESSSVSAECEIGLLICSDAIFEWNAFNHFRQSFESSNSKPSLLGTLHQFEHQ